MNCFKHVHIASVFWRCRQNIKNQFSFSFIFLRTILSPLGFFILYLKSETLRIKRTVRIYLHYTTIFNLFDWNIDIDIRQYMCPWLLKIPVLVSRTKPPWLTVLSLSAIQELRSSLLLWCESWGSPNGHF